MVGKVPFDEEDAVPKFHNSCLKKGAVLITCMDGTVKKWLKDKASEINVVYPDACLLDTV